MAYKSGSPKPYATIGGCEGLPGVLELGRQVAFETARGLFTIAALGAKELLHPPTRPVEALSKTAITAPEGPGVMYYGKSTR